MLQQFLQQQDLPLLSGQNLPQKMDNFSGSIPGRLPSWQSPQLGDIYLTVKAWMGYLPILIHRTDPFPEATAFFLSV
jgi:hypothetical protein